MEIFIQTAILLCSGAVAFLVGSAKTNVRRVGFAFGIVGQPFWLWTSIAHGQWAIVVLAIWYSICHVRGFKNAKSQTSQ